MKSFVALAALAAAVTAQIPDGCSTNSQGSFLISTQNVTGAPGQFDKVGCYPFLLRSSNTVLILVNSDK